MTKNRWTFRTLPQDLRDTRSWRQIDASLLGEEDALYVSRAERAIKAYIATGQLRAIAEEAKMSREELLRLLNRCVSCGSDGSIRGWAGLLGGRITPYKRESELPSGRSGAARGFVGAFGAFLAAHRTIKEKLDSLILKRNKRGVIHEACISAKTVHATLIRLCEEEGLTHEHYPLNSKSQGRRSVERYIHELIATHVVEGTRARFGNEAADRLRLGTGQPRRVQSVAPFDLVALDAHKTDCFGTVRIEGPAGPQWVPMERLWLVAVLELESRLILGYSIGIRTECSAGTIESALKSALGRWQPRALRVPGMEYKLNAALPSGVFPELVGCGWNTLTIDNAPQHFSLAIAERARRRIGCNVTYGPIGEWDHRAVMERLFGTLEKYGFQRLPSTTGTGPGDPKRDNPVRKAVEGRIEWEVLLDIADVVVANYNATQTKPLGNRTPLSAMHDHLYGPSPTFLPRKLPPATANEPELGIVSERRTVRGNQKDGRRPYVCIDQVNYTCPVLAKSTRLIDQSILVHIDESDMRTVRAYFASGEELGLLHASGGWARTKHSREMRKLVNSLRDSGGLVVHVGQDPIQATLAFLASKSYADARQRPHNVSKTATKVARIVHESGLEVPEAKPVTVVRDIPTEPASAVPNKLVKDPVWKTVLK